MKEKKNTIHRWTFLLPGLCAVIWVLSCIRDWPRLSFWAVANIVTWSVCAVVWFFRWRRQENEKQPPTED